VNQAGNEMISGDALTLGKQGIIRRAKEPLADSQ
jgi:hypothetical protein